jgi:oxygen-independent coproporphyrinogen-3 oxidase
MDRFGLYVHIPFCERKCPYCDFLSFAGCGKTVKLDYAGSLIREIKAKAKKYSDRTVSSIFFGGGTPTTLQTGETLRILKTIYESFNVASDAEVTTEANPGTVNPYMLKEYKKAGFNRISFGLQSADNKELSKLKRIHTYEEFLFSYDTAKQAGFDNINIDIMSALPGQTVKSYEETLNKVIGLDPAHISAYSLIIEENTKFYDKYKDGKGLPSENTDRKMYALTKEILEDAGYHRYEISNYAKEGYECRHNCLYWERGEYLGLGLGASSFAGGMRWKNDPDLAHYIASSNKQKYEIVRLTKDDELEETMFLGLRMMKGIKETPLITKTYGDILKRHEDLLLIERKDGNIRLTDKGIDVSNSIFADYIL